MSSAISRVLYQSGMTGQLSVDSDKTLLGLMDDAENDFGASFNNSVIKRALKALVHDDLKLCNFERLATTTLETIRVRFVADDKSDDDDVNCAVTFFSGLCAQVLTKLIKSALPKFKTKDTMTNLLNRLD